MPKLTWGVIYDFMFDSKDVPHPLYMESVGNYEDVEIVKHYFDYETVDYEDGYISSDMFANYKKLIDSGLITLYWRYNNNVLSVLPRVSSAREIAQCKTHK